jgi:hypothetical protein
LDIETNLERILILDGPKPAHGLMVQLGPAAKAAWLAPSWRPPARSGEIGALGGTLAAGRSRSPMRVWLGAN